ncbi:MAG: alpha/beta hydrolase family protein, partial [Spirochaetota bacterium]
IGLGLVACEARSESIAQEEASMDQRGGNPGNDAFTGAWRGELDAGGQTLPLIFRISTVDDTLSATMDSPQQSARGIPVAEVSRDGREITLELPALGASYRGRLDPETGTITGTFSQGGASFALDLAQTDDSDEQARRPQDPVPPFPYIAEDVTFTNPTAGITLAGTITRPEGDGPFPAAVLISGSGQQNRDEEIFGHRPFLVLADALTRAGVVVLRYDDRGVGGSEGRETLEETTSGDFAGDAASALRFLREQPYTDPERAGLIGHSEGGIIAMLIGAQMKQVPVEADASFLVLLAANAVPGDELLMMQSRALLEASGATPAYIETIARANREVYDIVLSDLPDDEKEERVARALRDVGVGSDQIEQQKVQLLSPWFEFFLRFDPSTALRRIDVPVLAVTGTLDRQVPADENLSAMRTALEAAPTDEYTVRALDGLNHLLQPAESGAVEEYAQIETTIAPEALELIAEWVAGQ